MPQEGMFRGSLYDTVAEGRRPLPGEDPYGGYAGEARGRMEGLRGQQEQGLGYYQEMIEGKGPSVAERQMEQGAAQNIAQSLQLQAQGRSGSMGAASRAAGASAAGQGMSMNQQAAILRAQEQQAAMGGYGSMANQMAQAGQQEMMGYDQLALARLQADDAYALKARELSETERGQSWERGMGLFDRFSDTLMGAFSMGGMSDIRVKQDVQPMGAVGQGVADMGGALPRSDPWAQGDRFANLPPPPQDVAAAQGRSDLASLGNYNWEYQPGMGPPGQRTGIMAQDLAANPSTQSLVIPTEQGMAVDGGGMASMALGASADQERRLQELEDLLKKQTAEAEAAALAAEEASASGGGMMGMLGGLMGGG